MPPASPRQAVYTIRTPAQVRALAAPARQEIIDATQAIGPCSIAEMGALLGRPADGLYYHVRPLVAAGLLRRTGERKAGRRTELLYDVPGRRMQLRYEPANLRAVSDAVASMLRLAERDFAAALRHPDAAFDGPRRNTWGGRVKGWVTEGELEEINRLLNRILEVVSTGRRTREACLHAIVFALTPLAGAAPRRARGAQEKGNH